MGPHGAFFRKLIYLAAIALLLLPLFWLGQPSSHATKEAAGSPGGLLARIRHRAQLSEAQLGEIDPTSVAVKLATLGLRGIAANILWEKANNYRMQKDWTNFGGTLNQITKLQPNFIHVWENQAWNLSYNISVEFDDYRERYRWVIKGFDFLKEGMRYNQRQPRLQWYMGWMISQKIGKADEHKQFRRLFKEDDDFHGTRPLALRDNWLVGKEWYEKAVEMVDTQGLSMMGKSPLIYRSSAPMCQMYYGEALEKDGTFGEVAKGAWATAAAEWSRYGNEDIPTSYTDENDETIIIHLNDQEREEAEAAKLIARLDAMQPGLREKLKAEKLAALTPAQREALDTPVEKRTGRQWELAGQAEETLQVTHNEVARRITGPQRKEALALAKEIVRHENLATYIRRYRDIVNFVSWRKRAALEQTHDMLEARRLLYQGDRAYAEGDLMRAREVYTQGLQTWRKVLDANPELVKDITTAEDLMEVIKRYRRLLSQLDEPFPEPFILQDVIDAYEAERGTSEKKPQPAPPES